jgi:hypothetical protein
MMPYLLCGHHKCIKAMCTWQELNNAGKKHNHSSCEAWFHWHQGSDAASPLTSPCPLPCLQISGAIAQVLTAKLGVPADRFYLKFVDVQRSDFGWSGSTF